MADQYDEFDPLADDEPGACFDGVDDEEIDFPIGDGANLKRADGPQIAAIPDHDDRPASVRTAELFDRMPARRKTLLGILRLCRQMQPVRAVSQAIDELKKSDRSVYTPNDFTTLLERAGAIERVGEDGASYEEVELEPVTVVVDGVEYLEPATPPAAYWRTTAAGCALLDADNPVARIEQVFEDEPTYLPIFKRILTLCSRGDGAAAKDLARAIDTDPLLVAPRYYSSRFVEKLNVAEALNWDGACKTWRTTDVGVEALAQLADVDDPASDAVAAL